MKILLAMNLPWLPSHGGANKGNRAIAEALAARGHEVRAVAGLADRLRSCIERSLAAAPRAADGPPVAADGPPVACVPQAPEARS